MFYHHTLTYIKDKSPLMVVNAIWQHFPVWLTIRLLGAFYKTGITENTNIIFLNGGTINAYANSRFLIIFKETFFDWWYLRPPLSSTSQHSRKTVNDIVSSLDIIPTLLDYADILPQRYLDGFR